MIHYKKLFMALLALSMVNNVHAGGVISTVAPIAGGLLLGKLTHGRSRVGFEVNGRESHVFILISICQYILNCLK